VLTILYSCYTFSDVDGNEQASNTFKRFLRVVNLINEAEKKSISFGGEIMLYPSEVHILCVIADNPGSNITDIAGLTGVTKGAVSQIVKKLEIKNMVEKYHGDSNKDIFLKLSGIAKSLIDEHVRVFTERECCFINKLSSLEKDSLSAVDDLFSDFEDIMKKYLEK